MRLTVYLTIINCCFVSCVDPLSYKAERNRERAEAIRKSDSLMDELKKMEDTIHAKTTFEGDTVLSKEATR